MAIRIFAKLYDICNNLPTIENFDFGNKENYQHNQGHHRRQASTKIDSNSIIRKNLVVGSNHRHNQSCMDYPQSLKLKEVDSNQIINQKSNLSRTGKIKEINYSLRPSSALQHNNYISSTGNEPKDLRKRQGSANAKTLISVSKNVNNIQMIPAPVYHAKEEQKYEPGLYCSSDSSSAATLSK